MKKEFVFCILCFGASAVFGASIILNEYNAVAGSEYLKDGGSDSYWGTVSGNGGDWFELVVIEDHLDIRNWGLEIAYDDGTVTPAGNTLWLTNDLIWSDLRSGTIITVSEDMADDVSYDPANGDWWINVNANDIGSDTYIEAQNFPVNENDWKLTIIDEGDAVMFGPAGEGVFCSGGISDTEVFRLESDPSVLTTPFSLGYDDGGNSTFGSANGGQDFRDLRSVVPEPATMLLFGLGGVLLRRSKR